MADLKYRGRTVTAEDILYIQGLIAAHPHHSRRALSKMVCEAWQWKQPNGTLCDMVCRGLLLMLDRAGQIALPPVSYVRHNPLAKRARPAPILIDATHIEERLGSLQPLDFQLVRRTAEEPLFNSLMEQHHYLGYEQPVGEHLKYLVWAQARPIACVAWSSAPRHLGSRDRYIGWSAEARRRNIRFVAYNTRFLILPWVRVEHLASHLLSRMAARISDDWQRVYLVRHWHPLTTFLRVPGAPLDNNIVERALKRAVLHRKNALFYRTLNGAQVGDLFMSLIHTCQLCGVNAFEYLTQLQRHARELAGQPAQWMPWNYREALARVRA